MKTLLVAAMISLTAFVVQAAEFHVSYKGTPKGSGSSERPWDLATALSHPTAVKPGDTIWLHGGTYQGSFRSDLKGTEDARIIVRQALGERAVIDIRPHPKFGAGFYAYGAWTRFQDFEVTCSNPKRRTQHKGSWPEDLRRGSIESRGSYLEFINLLVHDLGGGYGFWSEGAGGEVYGCLIYNNGWGGPDRGHGHGIYAQNKEAVKTVMDNIIFQQFGGGMHVYGSSKSFLKGFRIVGNVAFNNGCLYKPGSMTRGILVGGDAPLEDVVVEENMTDLGGLQLGYTWGTSNKSLIARKNYAQGTSIYYQDRFAFEENTVIGGRPVLWVTQEENGSTANYKIDRNTYYNTEPKYHSPFMLTSGKERKGFSLAGWRKQGFDANSKFRAGRPKRAKVFVRPNKYQPGRANIVVYNWDEKPKVRVDLKDVLKRGQRFRIVSARNFFGPTVVSGTYQGGSVSVPMKGVAPLQPVGMPQYKLPVNEPGFGVFVVLPE